MSDAKEFTVRKVDGGWIVLSDGAEKIVVKDNELIKNFKSFVETAKPEVLTEG